MTYTRQQVVDATRRYLGVRFVHQGRNENGLDCVGLCAAILSDIGYPFADLVGYNRTPEPIELVKMLRRNFDRIEAEKAQAGDVYLMKLVDPRPRHVAIRVTDDTDAMRCIEPTLIHALSLPMAGYVIEQPVSLYAQNNAIVGAFRLRGLTD